jgi:Fe-S cluster biogenesis protein NfuA
VPRSPRSGDVVIRDRGSKADPPYVVRSVPGPEQFCVATRAEAAAVARSYAERARVDVWFAERPGWFTLVARSETPYGANTMIERERIEAVLDRIRPFLLADGAGVELVEVRKDGASVRFTGLCECASAPLNMHTGLNEILHEEFPGFGDLRLV